MGFLQKEMWISGAGKLDRKTLHVEDTQRGQLFVILRYVELRTVGGLMRVDLILSRG